MDSYQYVEMIKDIIRLLNLKLSRAQDVFPRHGAGRDAGDGGADHTFAQYYFYLSETIFKSNLRTPVVSRRTSFPDMAPDVMREMVELIMAEWRGTARSILQLPNTVENHTKN